MATRQEHSQHADMWTIPDVVRTNHRPINQIPVSHFNPATPSFQPAQLDMQTPPATDHQNMHNNNNSNLAVFRPISSFNGTSLAEVKETVINYHLSHQRDVMRFEATTQAHSEDIAFIKQSAGNDLRSLHNQLIDLRAKVDSMGSQQQANTAILHTAIKERMLAEADGSEYYAKLIRAKAEALLPGVSALPHLEAAFLAIGSSPTKAKNLEVKAFETARSDVPHVAERIASPEPPVRGESVRVDTPTHVPARRAAIENKTSHAVEIKKPRDEEVANDKGVTNLTPNKPASIAPVLEVIGKGWVPQAVASMPFHTPSAMLSHTATFTWEHIISVLGGAQHSPGLYLTTTPSKGSPSPLKGRTFWLLEAQYEPYIPRSPGHHGAKLTAFFNDNDGPDEEDMFNLPVFVCLEGATEYTYMGHYSQTRYSDKLSHSEMFQRVPQHVLVYWAKQLADVDRPAWITEKLTEHFWPRPAYSGPIPTDSAIATPATAATITEDVESPFERRVRRSLERYARELKQWAKDCSYKANMLTEEVLMGMWDKSDLDAEQGLRLWWEYLECVGYEDKFYERLVALKGGKKVEQTTAPAPAPAPASSAATIGNAHETQVTDTQPNAVQKAPSSIPPHERTKQAHTISSSASTARENIPPPKPATSTTLPPHLRARAPAAPANVPTAPAKPSAPAKTPAPPSQPTARVNPFAGMGDMNEAKAFMRDASRGRSGFPAAGGRGPAGAASLRGVSERRLLRGLSPTAQFA